MLFSVSSGLDFSKNFNEQTFLHSNYQQHVMLKLKLEAHTVRPLITTIIVGPFFLHALHCETPENWRSERQVFSRKFIILRRKKKFRAYLIMAIKDWAKKNYYRELIHIDVLFRAFDSVLHFRYRFEVKIPFQIVFFSVREIMEFRYFMDTINHSAPIDSINYRSVQLWWVSYRI